MTKKELLEALKDFRDDDIIVVEVFDTTLYEDLYDFTIDDIEVNPELTEIRICPINHYE
jgi:hypothetical protein